MTGLRVFVAHNAYRLRGGEDGVVEQETGLLRRRGHEVRVLIKHNDDLAASTLAQQAGSAVNFLWSRASAAEVESIIDEFRPDVLHVHNTLALLSPSIYWAAARAGVPVVQTLHNFRLACPQAMFLRDERICEECLGRAPIPAVLHACYRGSRSQSLAVASMLTLHRLIGTWKHKVARYIALSEFCRTKFVVAGLPGERVRIKPNFTPDPRHDGALADGERSAEFLFVGRLSVEKGVRVLAEAMRDSPGLSCRAIGDGPARPVLAGVPGLHMPGWLAPSEVAENMRRAGALVIPSIWHEPFPLVALEALAHGLPIIASRVGSLPEIVEDGVTGLLFEAGDAADLAARLRWARDHPQRMREMGAAARLRYERDYGEDRNYRQLLEIYEDAIASVR